MKVNKRTLLNISGWIGILIIISVIGYLFYQCLLGLTYLLEHFINCCN